jgi:hypothetical protein
VDKRLKRESDLNWYKLSVDGDRVLLERPLRERGSDEKPLPPWKDSAHATDRPPKHSSRMRCKVMVGVDKDLNSHGVRGLKGADKPRSRLLDPIPWVVY